MKQSRIEALVQAERKRSGIPGLAVGVLQEGRVVHLAGYGRANEEVDAPATPDTVFPIASLTKQFTATAVLTLVEAGRVRLDEPIGRYLGSLPAAWEAVTVRQLLTHTSGIKSYTSVEGFAQQRRRDFTPPELLALVQDAPLEFAPGSDWRYSNTGYVLLGLLIERVAGKTYGAFLDERIFRPLGLRATRVNDTALVLAGRASGYTRVGTELRNAAFVSPTQPFAVANLVSSVRDLALWYAALAAGKLLRQATWQEAWTAATLRDGSRTGYGFGWEVSTRGGQTELAHGGIYPGFTAYALHRVEARTSVLVLTNLDTAEPAALARRLADTLPRPE